MSHGASRIVISILAAFLIICCGPDEENGTLRLQIELPVDWESLLDMEVLGAQTQTPYIGTIRIVLEDGDSTETWDFPWDDRSGSAADVDLKGAGTLRIEAVTAGSVIMEREIGAPEYGDVSVTLRESGGFSEAGSLLHYRQDHSSVAVGNTVLVIGGNTETRVIEQLVPSGDGFTSSAYGTSLVYARSGQDVLHDPASDRLFVFKGTSNEEEDIYYEVIDITNKNSTLLSLISFRKKFTPVIYNQSIFFFNGFNQSSDWFVDTLVLNTNTLSEMIEPLLGIGQEIENHFCVNSNSNFFCAGGSLGTTYYNDIWRFDLNRRINLPKTTLSSQKERFSLSKIDQQMALVTGGIGPTGYLNDVEIVDFVTGNSSYFGDGIKIPRINHASIMFDSNHVLIIGGLESTQISNTAEILDLTTGESAQLPWRMRVSRVGHTATLLPDGRVLVVGGNMEEKTVEVWNPPSGL